MLTQASYKHLRFFLFSFVLMLSGLIFYGTAYANFYDIPGEAAPQLKPSVVNGRGVYVLHKKKRMVPQHTFVLDPMKTLHQNMEDWAKKSGWTIVWRMRRDLRVHVRMVAGHSFIGAMRTISNSLGDGVRLKTTLHTITRVAIVEPSEN